MKWLLECPSCGRSIPDVDRAQKWVECPECKAVVNVETGECRYPAPEPAPEPASRAPEKPSGGDADSTPTVSDDAPGDDDDASDDDDGVNDWFAGADRDDEPAAEEASGG